MNLFRSEIPKRVQHYHHDNGDLEFISRDIVGVSASELDDTGEAKRSWLDPYMGLYPFDGFGKVSAGMVMPAYSRHYHLELHDILPDDHRPPDDGALVNPFTKAIAEARAFEIIKAGRPKTIWEKMTWMLGCALLMEMLIWGIGYAVSR